MREEANLGRIDRRGEDLGISRERTRRRATENDKGVEALLSKVQNGWVLNFKHFSLNFFFGRHNEFVRDDLKL